MSPLRSALFVLLVGGCAYGCAHGVEDLVGDVPDLTGGAPAGPSGASGGASTPDAGEPAPTGGPGAPDSGPGAPDSGPGAPDSGPGAPDAGPAAPDSGPGGPDAGPGAPDSGPGAPDAGVLDPNLDPPGPHGKSCKDFRGSTDCPFDEICRIATPTGGRCETYGFGGYGDPCGASKQCNDFSQCYAGTCTYLCRLGSYDCGKKSDCLDVGNATWGVCKP